MLRMCLWHKRNKFKLLLKYIFCSAIMSMNRFHFLIDNCHFWQQLVLVDFYVALGMEEGASFVFRQLFVLAYINVIFSRSLVPSMEVMPKTPFMEHRQSVCFLFIEQFQEKKIPNTQQGDSATNTHFVTSLVTNTNQRDFDQRPQFFFITTGQTDLAQYEQI